MPVTETRQTADMATLNPRNRSPKACLSPLGATEHLDQTFRLSAEDQIIEIKSAGEANG
jgi:hypothetical protein